MKSILVLRRDAGSDEMLRLSEEELDASPILVTSYHGLENEAVHRIINSYKFEELMVILEDEAELPFIEHVLTKVQRVNIMGTEDDAKRCSSMLPKLLPDKANVIRKAIVFNKDLLPIIKGGDAQ